MLYEKNQLEECEILNHTAEDMPTVTPQVRNMLEGDISVDEASSTLRSMTNNKNRGSDGFTAEFVNVFRLQLGAFVVRSLNEEFKRQELSSPQKEELIICIPKGDKVKHLITNWRPSSLLNVVFKIGSVCIANRITSAVPYDQRGPKRPYGLSLSLGK